MCAKTLSETINFLYSLGVGYSSLALLVTENYAICYYRGTGLINSAIDAD